MTEATPNEDADRLLDLIARAGGDAAAEESDARALKAGFAAMAIRRLEAVLSISTGSTVPEAARHAQLSRQGMHDLIRRWSDKRSLRTVVHNAFDGGPGETTRQTIAERQEKRRAALAAKIAARDERRRRPRQG